ncbi:MAG: phospholipase D family protein [Candidatus Anstonellales archaeon]
MKWKKEDRIDCAFIAGAIFSLCFMTILLILFSDLVLPLFGATHATPVFSPGAEKDIISLIDSARESIDIEVYLFTNEKASSALIEAKKRGVRVRLIVERRTDADKEWKLIEKMAQEGIEIKMASQRFTLTHSKFMIIDGRRALVGSMNFSGSAFATNREAGVILSGKIVDEYKKIFEEDWQEAT